MANYCIKQNNIVLNVTWPILDVQPRPTFGSWSVDRFWTLDRISDVAIQYVNISLIKSGRNYYVRCQNLGRNYL